METTKLKTWIFFEEGKQCEPEFYIQANNSEEALEKAFYEYGPQVNDLYYRQKIDMKTGIELIAQEREEQIKKHGRTIESDVQQNTNFELSWAAGLLATPPTQEIDCTSDLLVQTVLSGWNQEILSKMVNKHYRERLIIAGALIAAEIDRLDYSPL